MPEAAAALVDIIIPAYRGVEETLAAVASVASSRTHCRTPFELVVILDNPDDAEMGAALAGASFILLRNETNLGFVRTANRGMALHADRDVVLLNSDTLVSATGDWLDRLRSAAYAQTHNGTATPFSNNATICSYPRFCRDNPGLPAGQTVDSMDALCARVLAGRTLEIPTGVGFCMYIRRDCLTATGLFDAETFGAGYGEENDFCMRAAALGWRHVLAADVFVQHHGGVSFQSRKTALASENGAKLSRLHPSYDGIVNDFIARDPVLPLRRELETALLPEGGGEWRVMVTNTLPGGVARYIREQVAETASSAILRCTATQVSVEGSTNLRYSLPTDLDDLRRLLVDRLPARKLEIHQIVDMPVEIFASLNIPYDITVHDYAWICPQVTLIDRTREYCGEPSAVTACEECYRTLGPHKDWHSLRDVRGVSVEVMRRENVGFLEKAESVRFLSTDAARRTERYAPGMRRVLVEPPGPMSLPAGRRWMRKEGERLRVAYIGSLGYAKGYHGLYALALDVLKRGLPVDFHVIGGTADSPPLTNLGVQVQGPYDEGEIGERIEQVAPHVALFPGVLPETYSYTLSIAFAAGIWPVAYDLGAIAERIREAGFGTLIPLGTPAGGVNDMLLSLDQATRGST
jgi:GT2 family glycosyltransferase